MENSVSLKLLAFTLIFAILLSVPSLCFSSEVVVGETRWEIISVEYLGNELKGDGYFIDNKKTSGYFLLLIAKVTNLGNSDKVTLGVINIVDDQGRKFAEMDNQLLYLPKGYDVLTLASLNPAVPVTFASIFELPGDSKGLKLMATDLGKLLGAQPKLIELKSGPDHLNRLLWNGALNGYIERVKDALNQGANINAATKQGKTALYYALTRGNRGLRFLDVVEYLINEDCDLNRRFERGTTYLHLVPTEREGYPSKKHDELEFAQSCDKIRLIINQMLANGLDVNGNDENGLTPLHYSAIRLDSVVSNYLIQNGALVNAVDSTGSTPLMYALQNKASLPFLEFLIKAGADINAERQDGYTPLAIAMFDRTGTSMWKDMSTTHREWGFVESDMKHIRDIVILLRKHNALVLPNTVEYSTIIEAVMADDTTAVTGWLQKGVPLDIEEYGITPLYLAVYFCNDQVFSLLLEMGASPDTECQGVTPLILASYFGNLSYVQDMIRSGADVNNKDFHGSALCFAAKAGHTRIVEELLRAGAKTDIYGNLFYGTSYGRSFSYTPLLAAAREGHSEVVEILAADKKTLRRKGLSERDGVVALRLAAKYKHFNVARILLEKGIDPNKTYVKGRQTSALEHATNNSDWDMVKLLKEYGAKK